MSKKKNGADLYEQHVLPLQEAYQADYINAARSTMQIFASDGREVSADDIHKLCPVPEGMDRRVLGAVFKPKELWEHIGYRKSERRENHNRTIAIWRLRGAV